MGERPDDVFLHPALGDPQIPGDPRVGMALKAASDKDLARQGVELRNGPLDDREPLSIGDALLRGGGRSAISSVSAENRATVPERSISRKWSMARFSAVRKR